MRTVLSLLRVITFIINHQPDIEKIICTAIQISKLIITTVQIIFKPRKKNKKRNCVIHVFMQFGLWWSNSPFVHSESYVSDPMIRSSLDYCVLSLVIYHFLVSRQTISKMMYHLKKEFSKNDVFLPNKYFFLIYKWFLKILYYFVLYVKIFNIYVWYFREIINTLVL